jgi:hypothetical protein
MAYVLISLAVSVARAQCNGQDYIALKKLIFVKITFVKIQHVLLWKQLILVHVTVVGQDNIAMSILMNVRITHATIMPRVLIMLEALLARA